MDTINEFIASLSGDTVKIVDLVLRLIVNTIFCFIIARCFYFPKSRRRDFFFTYMLVGFAIFMLMHLMGDAKMKTGFAMGLFAIFCIMRYRTESVPIREMTYLFIVIAMSAINALAWLADISDKHPDFVGPEMTAIGELTLTNTFFVLAVWLAEGGKWLKSLSSKYIKYDKIDLITPDKREDLIADLKKRTGLDITHVEIGSIDFLKDMALIKIFYNSEDSNSESLQKMPKIYDE